MASSMAKYKFIHVSVRNSWIWCVCIVRYEATTTTTSSTLTTTMMMRKRAAIYMDKTDISISTSIHRPSAPLPFPPHAPHIVALFSPKHTEYIQSSFRDTLRSLSQHTLTLAKHTQFSDSLISRAVLSRSTRRWERERFSIPPCTYLLHSCSQREPPLSLAVFKFSSRLLWMAGAHVLCTTHRNWFDPTTRKPDTRSFSSRRGNGLCTPTYSGSVFSADGRTKLRYVLSVCVCVHPNVKAKKRGWMSENVNEIWL